MVLNVKHTKEIVISSTQKGDPGGRLTSHAEHPSQSHISFPWSILTHTCLGTVFTSGCSKILPIHLFCNFWRVCLVSPLIHWIHWSPFLYFCCCLMLFQLIKKKKKELTIKCKFYFPKYHFVERVFSFIHIIPDL